LAHRALQIREGGFAMIHGDPGTGRHRTAPVGRATVKLSDVTVAPSAIASNLADFTAGSATSSPSRCPQSMGRLRALRERWLAHLDTTVGAAKAAIRGADESTGSLRLLASARFDSQPLLCVVLAGDARLIEKLRREDLIPLGSRIRTRLATEHASREELIEGLAHLLTGAGNATLMTQQLRHTLCDHAAGNYRILTTMAAELLAVAAKRELPQLDEKLYLEVFAQPDTSIPRRAGSRR
jgi:hypothetical protein